MSDLAITPSGQMQPGDKERQLHKAADQMEGMFLGLLFKQMEESHVVDETVFGESPATDQFNQLFHTALSEKAAGSLGLADVIYKQLAVRVGLDAQVKNQTVENQNQSLEKKP
jgi:Rod binding domain-containing protein